MAVNEKHGLGGQHTPHNYVADPSATEPGPFDEEFPDFGPLPGSFTTPEIRRYVSARSCTADLYREHLLSLSLYRTLPPAQAEAAVDDTIAVIGRSGGTIDFVLHIDVVLIRRR